MAVVFTLLALKSIMLLLVLHTYITQGRTIVSMMEVTDECPMPCLCYNQTVVCSATNLKKVPLNIPTRTRALYLDGNAIEKLDFRLLSRLDELEELHLRGNRLSGIEERDIEFLPRLKHVDLRDNPLVCGCPLADVVRRTWAETMPLDVILGDTKCAVPMKDENRRAGDVLMTLDCRHRRRRGEGRCHPRFCLNDGTCEDGEHGPYCICPDSYVGDYCERTNSESMTIYLDDITSRSVKVSWRPSHHVEISRYFVTFQELHPTGERKHFWTLEDYYIFGRLMPGSLYEVCVKGYMHDGEELDECCKEFSTMPHPSYPKTNNPYPPHPPHQPTTESRDTKDVIHKAAVILGSIIGVCAFFIICLTLVYKFRTLSRPRNWGRRRSSSSHPVDEEAEEAETELSQVPGNENNRGGGRDLFVLSVPPEHPTDHSEAEADTAALDADPPLSTSDRIPMNTVLQALHPPGRASLDAHSTNTVLLYRPENRRAGGDQSTPSRDNPSGTTPIFLVADGNHYPLDPALSHVLRSAMSRSNPRDPLPNEPPPPYSEIAEDAYPTPPSPIPNRVEPDTFS